MTHTFVTFLGRGRLTDDPEDIGYQKTTYQFPNGHEEETSFFVVALAKQLTPDRVVILGTEGSQWSVLVEEGLASDNENRELRDELFEAEIEEKVTQEMLNEVRQLMNESIGCEVVPLIIPFGKTEKDQYDILNFIANEDNIPDGDVSLDLTHGFRHFGMIGFLSAFMLERVRNLTVKNLWYGAFDMRQGNITPVFTLDGLDRVRRWMSALERFEATGDYSVFAPLLTEDEVHPDTTQHLEKAAFYERTTQLFHAEKEIQNFLRKSNLKHKDLQGASGLFQKRLLECLKWVELKPHSKQQGKLARQYLERGDYVRAAIFGWETLVTQECETYNLKSNFYRNRKKQDVPARFAGTDNEIACRNLNQIRNAVTHGTEPDSLAVQKMLKDDQELCRGLQAAFNELLPDT